MAKGTLLCAFLCIATAHTAVINNEGAPVKRVVRSPHCVECESHGPPPGPPPPVFHTHQWTGVERTANGINGVFSGAAAAADNGLQTAGQAFSLASSGGGAAAGAAAGATAGAGVGAGLKTDSGAGLSARFGIDSNSANAGTGVGTGIAYNAGADTSNSQSFSRSFTGYGSHSAGGNGPGNGGANGHGNYNGNAGYGGGEFKAFRESHYTYGSNKQFDGQHGQTGFQGKNQHGFERNIGQTQSGGFGGQSNARAQSSTYGSGGGYSGGSNGYGSGFSGQESVRGNEQQLQSSGGGQWENTDSLAGANQQAQSSAYHGGYGGVSNGYGSGFAGRYSGRHEKLTTGDASNEQQQLALESVGVNEQQLQSSGGQLDGAGFALNQEANRNTQSALSDALNLAAQGVQASQQAQPAGCSTCGKGNYALSNAKSHSGNAIAVSVGG